MLQGSHRMSLEIMTLQPKCEDVETAEGVALTVTGVAQVKVMTDMDLLAVACEQFLGKSVQETKSVVLQTLEGHLRAILGTLTVEAIYQDRDQFAQLVREVAAPDVGRMGIEILSFTIKVKNNATHLKHRFICGHFLFHLLFAFHEGKILPLAGSNSCKELKEMRALVMQWTCPSF
ncbi:flotillin-2-like isoform X2 [Rhincodon typus]|uniref:flotillin-2-like isoform X2 n=1 Tax=Rhincodon typus TaxID=259920 RepID=UPI0020303476|nr:flotillin-2-like isoform X2 [Rhincodon typus]